MHFVLSIILVGLTQALKHHLEVPVLSGWLENVLIFSIDFCELKLNVQHGTERRGGPASGSFVLYLRRESYINYVRRVQVYTQFHQSINGVVNVTLRI